MLELDFAYEVDREIHQVSLSIGAGEMLGVFGPSGIGKSRLLTCIAGLTPIRHGDLRYQGTSWKQHPPWKRKACSIASPDDLFPDWTIRDNIPNNHTDPSKALELLHRLAIDHPQETPIRQLSMGQRQRVNLMRGLLAQPRVLLLDEPYSHLDHRLSDTVATTVWHHFRQLKIPGLLVDHHPDRLVRWCSRVLYFDPHQPPRLIDWNTLDPSDIPVFLRYNILPITSFDSGHVDTPIGPLMVVDNIAMDRPTAVAISCADGLIVPGPARENTFSARTTVCHPVADRLHLVGVDCNTVQLSLLSPQPLQVGQQVHLHLPAHKLKFKA